MDWRNLMKQSVTVGAQLLWGGRYGCTNGRYGCTIVMSYIEINKSVAQWLLTFNLCVSVTWPLTCAFHIPCTHTPEIIDMHRGVCDKRYFSIVRNLSREPDFSAENRIFKNFSKSLKTCLAGVFWVFHGILALFDIWAENRIFQPRIGFSNISQNAS